MKINRIACVMIILIVMFLALQSCAITQNINIPKLTPKQKASWLMNTYNTQFDDYTIKVKLPNLTNEEKKILRVKKDTLTYIYPLIQAYDLVVSRGGTPSKEVESEVMGLMNMIESMMIRVIK